MDGNAMKNLARVLSINDKAPSLVPLKERHTPATQHASASCAQELRRTHTPEAEVEADYERVGSGTRRSKDGRGGGGAGVGDADGEGRWAAL